MANITLKGRTISVPYPAQTISANGITVTFPQDSMTVQLADESVVVPDQTGHVGTDSLVLMLAQDAYQGNAKFRLTVDGVVVADNVEVTESNVHTLAYVGQYSQAQSIVVTFLNDSYGGTKATDRNLYVYGVAVNNKAYHVDKDELLSTGESATATPSNPNPAIPSAPNTEGTDNTDTAIKAGNVFKEVPTGRPVGSVDVTTLGFKGDGIFDNSPLFEKTTLNSLYFPAGTYMVAKAAHLKGNTSYYGDKGAIIKAKQVGQSVGYLDGDNTVIKGITFSGGELGFWDRFVSNVTIQYCTFSDFVGAADWESSHYIFAQHGCSGHIEYNNFYDRMPPAEVSIDPHVKGSIPDFGAGWTKEHPEYSNKDEPPCGIVLYGASDLSVSHNNFNNVFQPIKTLMLPGESWDTKYSTQSGLVINYNYAEAPHRIFIEQQSVNVGLQVIGNVAKHWKFPYWESYGLSLASPQSTGTVCRDNFIYHGDTPYNATPSGLGIEFGSQHGICQDNTVYGPWMIQVFGGSKGCKVNGNRIASNNTDKNFQFAGVTDEHSKTDTDYSGNDIRPGGGTFPKEWSMYDLSISGIKA